MRKRETAFTPSDTIGFPRAHKSLSVFAAADKWLRERGVRSEFEQVLDLRKARETARANGQPLPEAPRRRKNHPKNPHP